MAVVTRRGILAGGIGAPLLVRSASAQGSWPTGVGPIRLVVPFPAGGSVDAVARLVQAGLQQRLGANVIVENQPGASGAAGTARVAKAAPDGTNWLFVFDTHAVNPAMQQLSFDTAKDLEPVMLIGTAPNVLVTHPSKPYRTLDDVIAAAKQKPEAVTYGSIGVGSLGHLTMVKLGRQVDARLTHVPYRGGGPAMNDMLAGHTELLIGSAALVNPQVEAGALRPIVQFGPKRAASAGLKDAPTAAESGFPDLLSVAWWGVFGPNRTPKAMVDRFGADLRATLAEERVRAMLGNSQQIELREEGPAELQSFLETQMKVWGAVVRDNNIKADS